MEKFEPKVFLGDNKENLMKEIEPNSVDLFYLDPPYGSGRKYNQTVHGDGSHAQILAYPDTWRLDVGTDNDLEELLDGRLISDYPLLKKYLLGNQGVVSQYNPKFWSYQVYMASRLILMHDRLKENGILCYECDHHAAPFVQSILGPIFHTPLHKGSWISTVTWKRTFAHNDCRTLGSVTDVLLFYAKGPNYKWNRVLQPNVGLEKVYKHRDPDGRWWQSVILTGSGTSSGSSGKPWRGIDPSLTGKGRHWSVPDQGKWYFKEKYGKDLTGTSQEMLDILDAEGLIFWPPNGDVPRYKHFLMKDSGVAINNYWTDLSTMEVSRKELEYYRGDALPLNSPANEAWEDINLGKSESVTFDGQKPLKLAKRIITACTDPGDLIVDPFVGSGTTCIAAYHLGRKSIGMELSPETFHEARLRLEREKVIVTTRVTDVTDVSCLHDLEGYDWSSFVVRTVFNATYTDGPNDYGQDGYFTTIAPNNKHLKVCIQAKSGKDPKQVEAGIRDLDKALEHWHGDQGILVAYRKYIRPDHHRAAKKRGDVPGHPGYPVIQILAIERYWEDDVPMLGAKVYTPSDHPIEFLTRLEKQNADFERHNLMYTLESE
jgi:hypothetical protein